MHNIYIWSAEGKNRKKKTDLNYEPRLIPRSRCGRNRWKKKYSLRRIQRECYCWMFLSVSGLRRNEKRVASCMHAEIRTWWKNRQACFVECRHGVHPFVTSLETNTYYDNLWLSIHIQSIHSFFKCLMFNTSEKLT